MLHLLYNIFNNVTGCTQFYFLVKTYIASCIKACVTVTATVVCRIQLLLHNKFIIGELRIWWLVGVTSSGVGRSDEFIFGTTVRGATKTVSAFNAES